MPVHPMTPDVTLSQESDFYTLPQFQLHLTYSNALQQTRAAYFVHYFAAMNESKKGASPIDTLAFTESLGLQTFRRNARNAWSKEEDALLLQRMEQMYPEEYSQKTIISQDVDWDTIADVFDETRRGKDCRKRWTSSLDPSLRRGKWSEEEDKKLMELYKRHGALWQQVALEIKGRTEHQCLKRFLEVLDPAQRNRLAPWSESEDLTLVRAVKEHGTKWKTVAGRFVGRPPLTCRNRWRNLVNLVAKGRASNNVLKEMAQVVDGDLKDKINQLSIKRADDDGRQAKKRKRNARELGLEMSYRIQSNLEMVPDTKYLSSDVNGEEASGASQKVQSSSRSHFPLHESDIVTGTRDGIEWKYDVAPNEKGDTLNNLEPLKRLLKNGGAIQSQELAQYLIEYAARFNLEITVHQHIHHHYTPPSDTMSLANQKSHLADEMGSRQQSSSLKFDKRAGSPPRFYNVEPETQINRYQHFNYLPPLTETPKLNSSASSPANSSKGSTHHHHYHHHHHHHHDQNRAKKLSLEDEAANKESDLLKLLNEADGRNHNHENNKRSDDDNNKSNSMTPLTQAVQMVAAAEASGPFPENGGEVYDDKKMNSDHPDEDVEEGLDFFESMRTLNGVTRDDKSISQTIQPKREYNIQHDRSRMSAQPVSQHHPLHYFTSSVTPQPEKVLDEEEEDIINSYGLFYNAYQRDTPMEQATALDVSAPYGAIPFNPS